MFNTKAKLVNRLQIVGNLFWKKMAREIKEFQENFREFRKKSFKF